jgi:hypothetical protein
VTSHAYASSRTWTAPSGMTESFDRPSGNNNATGLSIEGNRVLQALAGATGAKTATAAAEADAGNTHILVLKPADVNLTISTPAGTVAGDVMIAAIGFNNAGAAVTPPSGGWTLVRRVNNASATSNALAVYRKTAVAGEPASQVFAVAGGTFLVGGIQSFSGVDTANPIDAENGQSTASATGHDTPSITTSTADSMLVTAVRMRMVHTSLIGTSTYQLNALGQRIRKSSRPAGTLKREVICLGDIPVAVVQ